MGTRHKVINGLSGLYSHKINNPGFLNNKLNKE